MEDDYLLKRLHQLYPDPDTTNFDVLDFVAAFGSPLEALMYSRLFWPEFVEIEGMVFLRETMEDEDDHERLADAFKRYGDDRTQTEKAFNLVEVPALLFSSYEAYRQTTEEEALWLARRLAEMWRACLHQKFPGRNFVVEVLEEDTGLDTVGVIFYQRRP